MKVAEGGGDEQLIKGCVVVQETRMAKGIAVAGQSGGSGGGGGGEGPRAVQGGVWGNVGIHCRGEGGWRRLGLGVERGSVRVEGGDGREAGGMLQGGMEGL